MRKDGPTLRPLLDLMGKRKANCIFFGHSCVSNETDTEASRISNQVLALVKESADLSKYYKSELPSDDIDVGGPIFLSHKSIIREIIEYEPGELLLQCGFLIIARRNDGSVCAASALDGTVIQISPGTVSGNGVIVKGARTELNRNNILRCDGLAVMWRSIEAFLEESIRLIRPT